MHTVIPAPSQTLLSLSRDELAALAACVERTLASPTNSLSRPVLESLLRDLRQSLETPRAPSTEVFDAWGDGFSIQLKAISAFGDPADLSAAEVKAKLWPLIEQAEAIP